MIIALSGLMGVGKSSIGIELSEYLGYEFIDLDMYITANEGKTVSGIFAESGEAVFREMEYLYLLRIMEKHGKDIVLSLGGGTPTYEKSAKLLRKNCLNVYLDASVEKITENLIEYGYGDRPLLKGLDGDGIFRYMSELKKKRDSAYRRIADIIIDVTDYSYIAC